MKKETFRILAEIAKDHGGMGVPAREELVEELMQAYFQFDTIEEYFVNVLKRKLHSTQEQISYIVKIGNHIPEYLLLQEELEMEEIAILEGTASSCPEIEE
jgi:transcription elongation factor GreA-like protein